MNNLWSDKSTEYESMVINIYFISSIKNLYIKTPHQVVPKHDVKEICTFNANKSRRIKFRKYIIILKSVFVRAFQQILKY